LKLPLVLINAFHLSVAIANKPALLYKMINKVVTNAPSGKQQQRLLQN
jgi:hypothetical protein